MGETNAGFSGRYALTAAGEWAAAGYVDAFSALSSLALHAVKRGFSESLFVSLAWRAGSAVRKRTRPYGERLCSKVYASAVDFAQTHSRGGSQAAFQRWVEDSAMWLHRLNSLEWRGRGSSAERKVLDALTERALRARELTVNGSLRLLAAETLLSKSTVEGALARLGERGLVRFESQATGARMVHLVTDGVDVFDALLEVYGSLTGLDVEEVPESRIDTETVFHEAFARKGLDRHHGYLYLSSGKKVTVRELAELNGMTPTTVRRHLRELQELHMAIRVNRTTWLIPFTDLNALAKDASLADPPTFGLRARMFKEWEKEREQWEELMEMRFWGQRGRKKPIFIGEKSTQMAMAHV